MRPRRAMWYVRRSWRCLCHFWSHWIIQRAWEEFKIHLYGTLWAFQGIQNGFHENNLFPQNTVIQRPAKMIMPMKKMKTNCCSLRQGRVGIAWWRKELLSEPNWRFPENMQKTGELCNFVTLCRMEIFDLGIIDLLPCPSIYQQKLFVICWGFVFAVWSWSADRCIIQKESGG